MDTRPEPVMQAEATGAGEPLVLVPGGLTGWLSWQPFVEPLAALRQVVRVQLLSVDLGLGNEPLPAEYSVEMESAALRNTLDRLGIARADVAAWSYGAQVALDFALDAPDRIRTLTLIEPPAFWVLRSRGPLDLAAQAFERAMRGYGPGAITEEQLARFAHFAGFVPPNTDPRQMPQWPVWSHHRRSLATGDVPFRHDDDIGRVRRFPRPVLLFKGEGSPAYLRGIIDILGEEFPHARVEELPGAHALHIVSMPRWLELFTAFISR